ncbi:MAG TPA: alpha/beta hydrolase [Pseudolysinimonas sp.]|nr:alpha/beta hydrolase [Pseudolysinimonas sp.]
MTTSGPDFEGRNWEGWTEPTIVDVAGTPTAYRRAGTGETLVYLHPGGGTREWTPLLEKLSRHYDVIAPEHPGFGDTPRGPEQDTWEEFVLHYDGFFRALGLEKFHLVGTSFGSWLAAELAVFYPDRFTTLSLVTPMGVLVEEDPFIDIFRLTPAQEDERMFNGRSYPPAYQETEADAIVQRYYEMTTVAQLAWSPRYDRRLSFRLARYTAPSLVIGVDDDRLLGTGQAATYAGYLPQSTLLTIHGPNGEPSGHGLTIEQPDEVVAAIVAHTSRAS